MSDLSDRLAAALADRYTLEREVGHGGMAVVFLARDTKLGRQVALKLLRPQLAAALGADRFLREIEIAAKLTHPNILPLHDCGEADGLLYYTMPYVEGESLRDRLRREHQLGVEEAVRIATDVCYALDYAHRHGVIHRDIKPENILLHDGRPLVADFGIALAVSAAGGDRLTETGLSVGTPEYMSPEQVSAERDISARSDLYSLGAVLYEMLTGHPPHMGASMQQVVLKILTEDPPAVTAERRTVPANIEAAVGKALEKVSADRFDSGAALAAALNDPSFRRATPSALAARPETPAARRRSLLRLTPWVVAGVAVLVAAVAIVRRPPEGPPVRAHIVLPDLGTAFDLSSDGRTIAYRAEGGRLRLRSLGDLEPRDVPGAETVMRPRFAPNGQSIAYYDDGLRRIAADGGPSVRLTDSAHARLAWGEDGFIYFTHLDGVLARVPEDGGAIERLTVLDSAVEGEHRCLEVLPDGRGVLFGSHRWPESRDEIGVLDLETREWRMLTPGQDARYAASGHLVVAEVGGVIAAARFDLGRLTLEGAPTPLLAGTAGDFALSEGGTLLYRSTSGRPGLLLVDRNGTQQRLPDEIADGRFPRFDPSGRRIALQMTGPSGIDVWVYDRYDGTLLRLTFAGDNIYPMWSVDGEFVLYASAPVGAPGDAWTFYRRRADGTGERERILEGLGAQVEIVQTPDGGHVFRVGDIARAQSTDLYALAPGAADPRPVATSPFNERAPAVSPDGRWVAYLSDESGREEVYVQSLRHAGGRRLVSSGGGLEPVWSPDGEELYYRSQGYLMAAEIMTTPDLAVGAKRRLFPDESFATNESHRSYDVTPRADAFLFAARVIPGDLVLVLNWFEDLQAEVDQ